MNDRFTDLCDQMEALLLQVRAAYAASLANSSTSSVVPASLPSTARFRACVAVVMENEGGYVNHPADPGGATNMGITRATLSAVRGTEVSVEDVKNLSVDEARTIYQNEYWLRNRCDQLPAGVDLACFDFAVNSGGAVRAIQRKLGVTPDGVIGPITLAVIGQFDPADLVERICDLRLAYLRELDGWDTFGKGWTSRVAKVRLKALAMTR